MEVTTTDTIEIGVPADDEELRVMRRVADYAFASSPSREVDISGMQRQGRDNFRLARVRGVVAGSLGIIPMGQWIGGRSVPMAGINAVAVLPEYRGTGVASQLLRRMLGEVRDQGMPISVLYPATQPVYRRAGYEHAGVNVSYRQPLHALDPRPLDLTVRRASEADQPALHRLYSERARRTAGNLDRGPFMWDRTLNRPDAAIVNAYLVERDGEPEGYITFTQQQEPGKEDREIAARDLVALTPDAGRQLLSFVAGHRSVVQDLVWSGSPTDPLLLHVPNQAYRIAWYEQWMLRVVDVRSALEARGYPEMLPTELHLEVRDSVLPWNDGRFVLSVAGGRADVREGGEGRVSLDVRTLAPMYTGYLSPQELRSGGAIEGPDADLRTLGVVFSGPSPWMPDGF